MRKPASLIIAILIAASTWCSSAKADSLAVGPLPDGRLQLFVISNGKLLTAWMSTNDPTSAWTKVVPFDPAPTGEVAEVTVGRLPDGRLQLFVLSASGVFMSAKQTTDPDSVWTPWQQF